MGTWYTGYVSFHKTFISLFYTHGKNKHNSTVLNKEGKKMEKKINNTEYDEDGIPKLEYIQVGEFLLPNLALDKVDGYIGVWGIRERTFKEHKPAVYSSMLLMDELNQHLIDIQKRQMKEWIY